MSSGFFWPWSLIAKLNAGAAAEAVAPALTNMKVQTLLGVILHILHVLHFHVLRLHVAGIAATAAAFVLI